MARPLRIQFPGALYHIIARGNERRDVFYGDDDFELFLANLEESCRRFHVSVHAYCLMTNHIHLLIETDKPNLSDFAKRLIGVYTLRFNRIHKRVGHLFQGRYKAFLVEKDSYLLEVSRYIHLNPVSAGIVERAAEYRWSSMRHYLASSGPSYLTKDLTLGMMSAEPYERFVEQGAARLKDPTKESIAGCILGSMEFAAQFLERAASQEGVAGKRALSEMSTEVILCLTEFEDKDLQMYSLWTHGRKTQKQIGMMFDQTESAVSHALKRVANRVKQDRAYELKIEEIGAAISSFKN